MRLAPLVAVVFFGFLSIGLPLPVLPRHVHDTLGYGPVMVGWAPVTSPLAGVVMTGAAGAVRSTVHV